MAIAESDLASTRMKQDWNARARSNAKWYINTVRWRQGDSEFDETGKAETESLIGSQLALLTGGRDPKGLRMLEIGCGIGRMTRHLAEVFGEVHATDVSGEMIDRARARLGGWANITFRETSGLDFSEYPDGTFDVILCAYVYQHVPSATVIMGNAADAYRVLRPGGVFKFQANGVTNAEFGRLPKDTWTGEAFTAAQVRDLARKLGAQMLGSQGIGRQHCWHLWRKPAGSAAVPGPVRIEGVRVPAGGPGTDPMGSLLVSGVDPDRIDVNTFAVELDGRRKELGFAGPASGADWAGRQGAEEGAPLVQLDFFLEGNEPEGTARIGLILPEGPLVPSVACPMPPPAPPVPVITLITNAADGGYDLQRYGLKGDVRLFVDHLDRWPEPGGLEVRVDGRIVPHRDLTFVPGLGMHLVPFRLPSWVRPGEHTVQLGLGESRTGVSTLQVGSLGRIRSCLVQGMAYWGALRRRLGGLP
jgi:ubiquinone/menaquinone biosynthesis C-methylase UbiE